MVTLAVARETVTQAFVTAWGVTTPYTLGNEKFTPPVGATWVRHTMQHLTGRQESLGGASNRKFERAGIVVIQLFVPLNTGMQTADGYLQTLRGIYEGTTLDGSIRFFGASATEIGPTEGWYQFNVEIPFTYSETK